MNGQDPTSSESIVLCKDSTVATLWLNRPTKRNAMTIDMWAEIGEEVAQVAEDDSVRVLVVRGAGTAFCAGADISGLNDREGMRYADINRSAEDALANFPKPSIAFIDGPCVGGGVQLALACDLRLGTTEARVGITPARLGVLFPPHSLERVVRHIGPSATKLLLFTAEILPADHAERIGLLDEVHPPARARERLASLCQSIVSGSQFTQQASKQMIDATRLGGGVDQSVIDVWLAEAMVSTDRDEGISAFLEHRSPTFAWSHTHTPRASGSE
jgi:enoyl-CoA hydratase/carnithine racemase